MTTAAIILAAGRGSRAGGSVPKQWSILANAPVIAHTLGAFFTQVAHIVLVIRPEDHARVTDLGLSRPIIVTEGGETRAQSVRNGLDALQGMGVTRVLIHDGARPFASPQLIAQMLGALDKHRAAAPALAVTDALWRGQNHVEDTVARHNLWRAQTPQAFHFDAIAAAHARFQGEADDDVAVARAAGIEVAIVLGEEDNIKITFPHDFSRAEVILQRIKHA